jgi:kynurenine formamidase
MHRMTKSLFCSLRPNRRVLFKTRNSRSGANAAQFHTDFTYLDLDAAKKLAERGIKLVGHRLFIYRAVSLGAGTRRT